MAGIVAIVGRPNVGKSTLFNRLIGERKAIVDNVSGVTRDRHYGKSDWIGTEFTVIDTGGYVKDSNDIFETHIREQVELAIAEADVLLFMVDAVLDPNDLLFVRYKAFNNDLYLVDTAGVRKKSKVSEDIEFYSVMRSIRAIENVDVVALVIDATRGIESQDMNLFGLAQKNGKGIVIIINKWDLIEKDNHTAKEYEALVKEKIAPFTDVPILFVSALTKKRVLKALDTLMDVYESMNTKISTSKLNDFFQPIIERKPPPSLKGKYIKIKYVTQLPTRCPSFAFFCNLPQYIGESYKRFLENKLREKYNFSGIPLRIYFRKK